MIDFDDRRSLGESLHEMAVVTSLVLLGAAVMLWGLTKVMVVHQAVLADRQGPSQPSDPCPGHHPRF